MVNVFVLLLQINLRHGLDGPSRALDFTCTACAGTLILEFAALSRLTGNSTYEVYLYIHCSQLVTYVQWICNKDCFESFGQ